MSHKFLWGNRPHCVPKVLGCQGGLATSGLNRLNWFQKLSGSQFCNLDQGSDAAEKPGATLFTDGKSGKRETGVCKNDHHQCLLS